MIRINKIALALLLVCTPTALASEGLYAGISIGTAYVQADVIRTTKHHLNYTFNAGQSGAGFGAFLGYNHLITGTPLFIGLEAGVHSHNLGMRSEQHHRVMFCDDMIIKTNHSMSGVFKFGVAIDDLMIYAKAGIFKTQWRLSLDGCIPHNSAYSGLIKTNSYGDVYGFGVEHKLNKNWSLGIDHSINTAETLEFKVAEGTAKIDPVIRTTSMRLTYTF